MFFWCIARTPVGCLFWILVRGHGVWILFLSLIYYVHVSPWMLYGWVPLIHVIYFELRTLISFTLYTISLCCHQSPKRGRLWETWPLEVMVSVINDNLIMLLTSSWHEGILVDIRAHWFTKWDPSILIHWRTAWWLNYIATRSRIDSSKCRKVERRALKDYLLVSR